MDLSVYLWLTVSVVVTVGVLVAQSGHGSKCVPVAHSKRSPNCWCACGSEWVWI